MEITPSGNAFAIYSYNGAAGDTTPRPYYGAGIVATSDGTVYGPVPGNGVNVPGAIFKAPPGEAPEILYMFSALTPDASTGLFTNEDGAESGSGV